jgi:alkylation response protein AidB-like acyl-CoA dehydrogenase
VRRVRSLHQTIAERALEIERMRRVPADLHLMLDGAGCYSLLSPTATVPDSSLACAAEVIEAAAEADGSVGWLVAQNALGHMILSGLPAPTITEIYGAGSGVRVAGVFAARGAASHTRDGWRANGRGPFASGCEDATWIYLQCVVTDRRHVTVGDDGLPRTKLLVVPRSDVAILDTWDAVGLRGTGSHDVQVRGVVRDERWTYTLDGAWRANPEQGTPGLADKAGLLIAAVSTGIALAAIMDVTTIAAGGKRSAFSARALNDDPVFQDAVGRAYMRVQSARALLFRSAERLDRAAHGDTLGAVEGAAIRAACREITSLAVEAVDTAFTEARSSSLPATAPLQRRLRDIRTLTQHAWNARDFDQQLAQTLLARGAR